MNENKTYTNPRLEAEIHNWPFGRDRATAKFSIETDPKRGQRAVRITIDPLTGKSFAPKKLTFAWKARIVDGSDGKTYILENTGGAYGHLSVMQGNMKYQQEAIFENDPRYAQLIALFDGQEVA